MRVIVGQPGMAVRMRVGLVRRVVGAVLVLVVLVVHVESETSIRIISMRKADSNETNLYYQNVGYF